MNSPRLPPTNAPMIPPNIPPISVPTKGTTDSTNAPTTPPKTPPAASPSKTNLFFNFSSVLIVGSNSFLPNMNNVIKAEIGPNALPANFAIHFIPVYLPALAAKFITVSYTPFKALPTPLAIFINAFAFGFGGAPPVAGFIGFASGPPGAAGAAADPAGAGAAAGAAGFKALSTAA